MTNVLFVSACVVALSTAGAFAQSQPAPGASSEGNVGPGAGSNMPRRAMPRTTPMKPGTTIGMSRTRRNPAMANPSSGGNVGPGTSNNSGPQAGGR